MYTPQEHDMMQEFMGQAVVSKLKASGEGVKVYPCAKFVHRSASQSVIIRGCVTTF